MLDAPVGLTGAARERWLVLAPELAARGPLNADLLATYCQVYARWRQAEDGLAKSSPLIKTAKGGVGPNPLLAISNQAAQQVRALERQLGISGHAEPARGAEDAGQITRVALAALLGVHPITVSKWERAGLPIASRGRRGKASLYDVAACRAWLDARDKAATGEPVDIMRERARKERAQAQLAEQMYAVRAKSLLPAEEVEKAWSEIQSATRAKLLALPQAYADRLARAATLHGVSGAESAIRDMVHECLSELARGPQATPKKRGKAKARKRRATRQQATA